MPLGAYGHCEFHLFCAAMGIAILKSGLLVYRPLIIFFVLKGTINSISAHQKARLHFPEMLCDETNSDTYYGIATELPIE
jgi:hypothetical protein